tara:strand:+ start:182 stop:529 length:348 start_codon:yes stop_codon:yes gene_type:complete
MSWEEVLKKLDMYIFPKAKEYLDKLDKDLDILEELLKGGVTKNRNKLIMHVDIEMYENPDFEYELDEINKLVEKIHDKDAKIRAMKEYDEFTFMMENERAEAESGYYDSREDQMI